jgi:hypothetical protein
MALWLGLVAIPIVLLYLRRPPLERRTVATGMFWQEALAVEARRDRWRRWRPRVSLAVELVLVAAATLAAAGLQIPRPRLVVLVVDNCASMNAQDVAPTRLAAAKELAGRMTDELGTDDRMAVVTTGGIPAVVAGPTGDAAALRAAIESIGPTSEASQMAGALATAETFPLPAGHVRRIVVLSDGCSSANSPLSPRGRGAGGEGAGREHDFELIRFGAPVPNTAITRLVARRTIPDPRACEVLIEARNCSDRPAGCRLTVVFAGRQVDTVKVSMAAGGHWQQVFRMTSAAGGRLTARLDPPDAYPADNEAAIDVPPLVTYRVTLDSAPSTSAVAGQQPDDPLLRALRANPRVEIVDPEAKEKPQDGGPSVAIRVFRGAPEKLPPGRVLVVDPAGCKLAPVGPDGRLEVLACNPDDSDLATQAELPVLVADALDRLAGQPVRSVEKPARPSLRDGARVGGVEAGRGIDFRKAADFGVDPSEVKIHRSWPSAWLWPAGLALLLLVVEWCLYQRRWMT